MADRADLEEAERLALQLPFSDRLRLMARICQELSAETEGIGDQRSAAQDRLAELDSWLAECDALRGRFRGKLDAVEEVRRIREERADPR
jgi:hypothetical protein